MDVLDTSCRRANHLMMVTGQWGPKPGARRGNQEVVSFRGGGGTNGPFTAGRHHGLFWVHFYFLLLQAYYSIPRGLAYSFCMLIISLHADKFIDSIYKPLKSISEEYSGLLF